MRRGGLIVALCAMALAAAGPAQAPPRAAIRSIPAACLLPWPNDYFRKRGHLALTNAQMPRSTDGKPIVARDYNWSDGFSPGQILVTLVPGST